MKLFRGQVLAVSILVLDLWHGKRGGFATSESAGKWKNSSVLASGTAILLALEEMLGIQGAMSEWVAPPSWPGMSETRTMSPL